MDKAFFLISRRIVIPMVDTRAGRQSQKALLVISFGTKHQDTRLKTIDASEQVLSKAFPDHDLKRAFTAQKIIKIMWERDGIEVDSVQKAAEKIYQDGYREVLAQPLHVLNGSEYYDLLRDLAPYADKFEKLTVGSPLLSSPEDYLSLVEAVADELPDLGKGEAVVLMGHGTDHPANASYPALDYTFKRQGYKLVHIGTVEGFPGFEDVCRYLEEDKVEIVYLMPLMLVAGEHAKNDMAGEGEESWKSRLESAGYQVEARLIGLGEMAGVQQMYVDHARKANPPIS
jgi:sirohydrochlorin cobaltochelatase